MEVDSDAENVSWSWLPEAEICLPVHSRNVSNCKKFFSGAQNLETRFTKLLQLVRFDTNAEQKQSDIKQLIANVKAVQAELLSCQTQLDQLSTECMEVCPIYARQSNPANPSTPCAVIAVCDYARNQVEITKNMIYLLTDNSDPVWWQIETIHGREISAPAVIFVIPPPDKLAVSAIERLCDCALTTWDTASELYKKETRAVLAWKLFSATARAEPEIEVEQQEIRKALENGAIDVLAPSSSAPNEVAEFRERVIHWIEDFDRRAVSSPARGSQPQQQRQLPAAKLIHQVEMFDVYLRAYKDTRLAKQLTKQIIDNMLSRLHIGGRAFAERLLGSKMLNLASSRDKHDQQSQQQEPSPVRQTRPVIADVLSGSSTATLLSCASADGSRPVATERPKISDALNCNVSAAIDRYSRDSVSTAHRLPKQMFDPLQFRAASQTFSRQPSEFGRVVSGLNHSLPQLNTVDAGDLYGSQNAENVVPAQHRALNATGEFYHSPSDMSVKSSPTATKYTELFSQSSSSMQSARREEDKIAEFVSVADSLKAALTVIDQQLDTIQTTCSNLSSRTDMETLEKLGCEFAQHEQQLTQLTATSGDIMEMSDSVEVVKSTQERVRDLTNRIAATRKRFGDVRAKVETTSDAHHCNKTEMNQLMDWLTDASRRLSDCTGRPSVNLVMAEQQLGQMLTLVHEFNARKHRFQDLEKLTGMEKNSVTEMLRLFERTTEACHSGLERHRRLFASLTDIRNNTQLIAGWVSKTGPLYSLDSGSAVGSLDLLEEAHAELESKSEEAVQLKAKAVEFLSSVRTTLAEADLGQGQVEGVRGQLEDESSLLQPLMEVQCSLYQLRELIATRATHMAMGQMLNLETYLDHIAYEVDNVEPAISADNGDSLAQQIAEIQSVHDEVERRCRGVSDSLSKYLRVMRCVTLDEVLTARQRIEKARFKADNVIAVSANRVNHMGDMMPLLAHFHNVHGQLQSSLAELQTRLNVVDVPLSGNTESIRGELRDAQMIFDSIVEKRFAVAQLLDEGQCLTARIGHDDDTVAALMEDMKEIRTTFDQMKFNVRRKLVDLKQTFENTVGDAEVLADVCYDFLRVVKLHTEHQDTAHSLTNSILAEHIADNQAQSCDLHHCQLLIGRIRQLTTVEATSDGASLDNANDMKQRTEELERLHDNVANAIRTRSTTLADTQRIAAKFEYTLNVANKALGDVRDHELMKRKDLDIDLVSRASEYRKQLQAMSADVDKAKKLASECVDLAEKLQQSSVCSEMARVYLHRQIRDLQTLATDVDNGWRRKRAELEIELADLENYESTHQATIKLLSQGEDELRQMCKLAVDHRTVFVRIDGFKSFSRQFFAHSAELSKFRHYCQLLHGSAVSATVNNAVRELAEKWHRLVGECSDKERQLLEQAVTMGSIIEAADELMQILEASLTDVTQLGAMAGDELLLTTGLHRLQLMQKLVPGRRLVLDSLKAASSKVLNAEQTDAGRESASVGAKLSQISDLFDRLHYSIQYNYTLLRDQLGNVTRCTWEADDLLYYVDACQLQLKSLKLPSCELQSANAESDQFSEWKTEVERRCEKIKTMQQIADLVLSKTGQSKCRMADKLALVNDQMTSLLAKTAVRQNELRQHVAHVECYLRSVDKHFSTVKQMECHIDKLPQPSRLVDSVLQQIHEHTEFERSMTNHQVVVNKLLESGTYLRFFGSKDRLVDINNTLRDVHTQWKQLVCDSEMHSRRLVIACRDDKRFFVCWNSLCEWLDNKRQQLIVPVEITGNNIDKVARSTRQLHQEMEAKQGSYYSALNLGRILKDSCSPTDPERSVLSEMMQLLKTRWRDVWPAISHRENELHKSMASLQRLTDATESIYECLLRLQKSLAEDEPLYGDLQTVQVLTNEHRVTKQQIEEKLTAVSVLRNSPGVDQGVMHDIEDLLSLVMKQCGARERKLQTSLQLAEEFRSLSQSLSDFLSSTDSELDSLSKYPRDEHHLNSLIQNHSCVETQLVERENELHKLTQIRDAILHACHPNALAVIKHNYAVIDAAWHRTLKQSRCCSQMLHAAANCVRGQCKQINDALSWTSETLSVLTTSFNAAQTTDLKVAETQLKQHNDFHKELVEKRKSVEKLFRNASSTAAAAAAGETGDKDETAAMSESKQKLATLQQKWNMLWRLSLDTKKKLQDNFAALLQSKTLNDFNFNAWKKRYTDWNNSHYLRLTDVFRNKINSRAETLTRKEFIEGILATKFPTTRSELNYVFDIIDNTHSGEITYKQFINVLHYDRPSKPKSTVKSEDLIQDAIEQQLALCQCPQWYPVQRVDDGVYRFGDKRQRKEPYFVRAVNHYVMVRIGCNWEPIADFFERNDPCRAKSGRSTAAVTDVGTVGGPYVLASSNSFIGNSHLLTKKNSATTANESGGVTRPTQLVRSHSVLTPSMTARLHGTGDASKASAGQWPPNRSPTSGSRLTRDAHRRSAYSSTGARLSRSPQTTDRLTFNGQRIHTGWPPINY